MKAFTLFMGVVALLILSSVWTGFVFSILWGWFIVPFFHLPPISIALAIGVGMVVRMLTYQASEPQKKPEESLWNGLIQALFYPLFV